jgi:hypothetical protein
LVADDHADPIYSAGTVLDCAAPGDVAALKGRRVVAFAARAGGGGLGEVVVANVENVVGKSLVLRTVDGDKIDGDVIGVVQGHYSRDL